MSSTMTDTTASLHLSTRSAASEIERAWQIVCEQRAPGPRTRVVFIMLHEPAKKVVLEHRAGDPVERSAFLVLVDSAAGRTYEAVVSLTEGRVLSWEHVPGVQPALVLDEFLECEAACGRTRVAGGDAQARHDRFPPGDGGPVVGGNFGLPRRNRRLVRALTWVRRARRQRLRAAGRNVVTRRPQRDGGARGGRLRRGSPATRGRATVARGAGRRGPASSRSNSSAGGAELLASRPRCRWQKWHFRIGFTPREGLVLHTITYRDQGRERRSVSRLRR